MVREAFARADGYEVDYEGDAFFYAFASAQAAVDAVEEAMRGLESCPIRIRVGLHTGSPAVDPPKYVGRDDRRPRLANVAQARSRDIAFASDERSWAGPKARPLRVGGHYSSTRT